MPWTTEFDHRISRLQTRLTAFYNNATNNYSAFKNSTTHDGPWAIVNAAIRERLDVQTDPARLKVLEFGAGRTLFATQLGPLRQQIHLTVQDVTNLNMAHLNREADTVHIGPLNELQDSFDIIFSTYVWEHIATPMQTLDLLLNHLQPGGSLFIFCPRYDMPGYVPPSLRHRGIAHGLVESVRLFSSRVTARVRRRPQFLINIDPAVFHGPWYRDADAVHLVSRHDLRAYLRRGGVTVRDRWPPHNSIAHWLAQRLLKLCVEVRKG